ncbi:MAG: ATPase domain-containing protein [Candidatus Micrarchaeia archaeon]
MENTVKKKLFFTSLPRVPSGIFGLDDMMEGGFEKNSLNLICGESGSGKTLFAMQFIFFGAQKYNDNSLFISFEETKDELKRRMARFGFDLTAQEASGKLLIYSYSLREVNKFIEDLPNIESLIKKNKISRIAFDSLTTYSAFFDNPSRRTLEIISLIDKFKKLDCTIVITSDLKIPSKTLEAEEGLINEYLVDSVISLYSVRRGDIRDFGLEIIKMRGTNHSRKIVPMRIVPTGMIVYPDMPFIK